MSPTGDVNLGLDQVAELTSRRTREHWRIHGNILHQCEVMVHSMAHVKVYAIKGALRCGIFAGAAALVLASCNAPNHNSSGVQSHPLLIATAVLNPNSMCAPDQGDYVRQTLNGDYTGCFRVPALRGSSLVVALQSFVQGTNRSLKTPVTTSSIQSSDVRVSLSPPSNTAIPGETITLTGHLSRPVSSRQKYANLCWDGCDGLQEQAVNIHWMSSTTFRMPLLIPKTAWLDVNNGAVTVRPLISGSYQVGVQCLTSISGCALRPPEAQTTIRLKAPGPAKCVRGRSCETMTLSTSRAVVGDEVMVNGWAPLGDIIGQPFGYSLSVVAGSARTKYPPLSYAPTKFGGNFNVVIAPTPLRIGQSPWWASLGKVSYLSSTYSGPTAVDPVTSSRLVGWCEPSGVVVTGGTTSVAIPTIGIANALQGSTLHIMSRPSGPQQCIDVHLDPHYPNSVFAGFTTGQGNSIPPVYMAPLYTTNAGTTWRTVPIPKGLTIEGFGGFFIEGSEVVALFENLGGNSNQSIPFGTNNGYVTTEVTSNGGESWTTSTLGCPSSGPCVTFGPYQLGHCGMTSNNQPLLVGPLSAVRASGMKWRNSTWVTTVNNCFAQQLVASSPREMFLLDPSSEYPLLRSTNGGTTWSNFKLPSIAGTIYSPDSFPLTNSLVLAPNGSLFASVTTSSGNRQKLFRLYPAAKSWCQIPRVFGVVSPYSIGPLRVNATNLIWIQSSGSLMRAELFSKLKCR
jgi:hypothetical protein